MFNPHDSPLVGLTGRVAGVTTSLIDLDREVRAVEVTLEGDALDVASIEEAVEQLGGTDVAGDGRHRHRAAGVSVLSNASAAPSTILTMIVALAISCGGVHAIESHRRR